MHNSFAQSTRNVIEWAANRGILGASDPKSQMLKCVSEVGELADAIAKNNRHEIIDAFGDTLVTLIILAHQTEHDLEDCLDKAYNIIRLRTGAMQNGIFVKDEIPS